MPGLSKLGISFILIGSLLTPVAAQDNQAANSQRSAATVTASASGERVRFAAPSSVVQIRLEVYNSTGKKLFDNELRGGNVLDWRLQDGQAEPLADETYLCVLTVKSVSGKITQRIGSVRIEKGSAGMQPIDASQITAQQTQAIGPIEDNASLTVLQEDDNRTTTVIAHNGEEGQIVRGKGALSFRIGDFFRGKDTEQMRLTAEGNLGIGITHPTAKLEVDGLIRATQGVVFPDGSIQLSAASKTLGASSLLPGQSRQKHGNGEDLHIETTGTGTTGKISKWSDGPNGVLADSNITELNGSIGINGTPDTRFKLDVNGSTRIRGSNPGFNLEGLRSAGNIWLFQTVDDDGRFRLFSQDNQNPGVERFTINLSTGNVGIGATSPNSKLDVRGHLVLDPGTDPILYTGTANSELNRYFQLINSPASPTASGLKAGGLLVADSYGFGNPGKNDLIVKGNTGLGTSAPQSKLHVLGGSTLVTPFRGLTIDQIIPLGSNTSGNALNVTTTTNGLTATNLLIDSFGNVGVGTATPTARLTVSGAGAFNAGSAARFDLFNTAANTGFLQNVTDGGLWQLATTAGTTRMVVDTAGRVGIGTASPTLAKLQVNDTSVGTAIDGSTSTNGSGVFGESTGASGVGVYGNAPGGGYAMYANGNTGQARDKGGFVKAMAFVNADGTIIRCYNGLTGSSSGNCGFAATNDSLGIYTVTFGFRVDDRFIVATSLTDGCDTAATIYGLNNADAVINIHYIDGSFGCDVGNFTNAPFYLIVF